MAEATGRGRRWPTDHADGLRSVAARSAIAAALISAVLFTAGGLWLRHVVFQERLAASTERVRNDVASLARGLGPDHTVYFDWEHTHQLVRSDGVVLHTSDDLRPYPGPLTPAPPERTDTTVDESTVSLRPATSRPAPGRDLGGRTLTAFTLTTPSDRLGTVDLAHLTRTFVAARDPAATTITCHADTPTPVRGNPRHLQRLLRNLLDNAEQHARSRITVTVHPDHRHSHATLQVTDDGPGIPPADHDRVFHRFTRLDEARTRHHGGAGLGLPIARDIATSHRGTLHLTPTRTGAHLTATLPLHRPTPASEQ